MYKSLLSILIFRFLIINDAKKYLYRDVKIFLCVRCANKFFPPNSKEFINSKSTTRFFSNSLISKFKSLLSLFANHFSNFNSFLQRFPKLGWQKVSIAWNYCILSETKERSSRWRHESEQFERFIIVEEKELTPHFR